MCNAERDILDMGTFRERPWSPWSQQSFSLGTEKRGGGYEARTEGYTHGKQVRQTGALIEWEGKKGELGNQQKEGNPKGSSG